MESSGVTVFLHNCRSATTSAAAGGHCGPNISIPWMVAVAGVTVVN